MKRVLSSLLLIFFLIIALIYVNTHIHADQLDDLTKQINDLTTALNQSINATAPLQSQLDSLQQQIAGIRARVGQIEADVAQKQQDIDTSEKDLAKKQQVLNGVVRDYYIKSYYNNPLSVFLSLQNAASITQVLAYQKAAEDQDKTIITNIALSITSLQQQQADLESEKSRLTTLKATLDDQSAKLDKVVSGAKAYQASLSSQIAVLSAQQQQLLAAKYATLGIPTTAYTTSGGCSSDINPYKDPGFGGTKFGFFTYGVPNRVGLNQYGAKGRAEANQSYDTILHAYYNADITSGYNQSINIHVTGTNDYGQSFDNNWSIEEYLKHIYEIPASWPMEALKAQAIAARSYALAYTNNGASSICPDQHCQEVKQELNSQAWIDAVNATAGQVLTSGGQPIKAWFSSTHGGYVYTSSDIGWSGTSYTKEAQDASSSINSWSDLQNNAYDKASPWFYCDWGGRSSNNNTAWLTSSEVADIANAVTLAGKDSSTKEHLYQTDKSNPAGVDTWSADRVRQELQSRGIKPFTSVSSISVSADFGSGKVTNVSVSGDGDTQSYSGDFFKTYFDLRAPANIQIVGPLYNIETR